MAIPPFHRRIIDGPSEPARPSALHTITLGALLVERAIALGPPNTRATMRIPESEESEADRQRLEVTVEVAVNVPLRQLREIEAGLREHREEWAHGDRAAIDLEIRFRLPKGTTVRLTA